MQVFIKLSCIGLAFIALSACVATTSGSSDTSPVAQSKSGNIIQQEIEAPEQFSRAGKVTWDGRPSLGGVWVAHGTVKKPQRAQIKNLDNGKTTIGALFAISEVRGSSAFELSSDAAEELGIKPNQPANLEVVALKIVEIAQPTQAEKKAELKQEVITETPKKATTKKNPAPKATGSGRYVQLGLFGVEANATKILKTLESKGISGKIIKITSKGKTLYRVLAGPAANGAGEADLLKSVKALGFQDAYLTKG